MMRYHIYPAPETQEHANDLLARAAWFFAGRQDVAFTVQPGSCKYLPQWECPADLDPAISALWLEFAKCVQEKQPRPDELDAIFLWQDTPHHQAFLKEQFPGVSVWRVDKERTRMEGSFWMEAMLELLSERPAVTAEASSRLRQCQAEFAELERSVILASGPSVAAYETMDAADALGIVCNSVIMDDALMGHIRPRLLCFADPLFHFGPSLYAAEFRRKAIEVVRAYNLWVVIPIKYYLMAKSRMPSLADRLIALPYAKKEQFNLDLASSPELKVTANILTYLLLPLAATFTRKIQLLGCDGRPLSDNQYFWKFNPTTQINAHMDNIKRVHPAFFQIDYNDYYQEHCDTLQKLVQQAEAEGRSVESLAPSYIPVLERRSPPPSLKALEQLLGTSDGEEVFISINPDLVNRFGHFLHFDARLAEEASSRGIQFITLASRSLELSAEEVDFPVLPFFSMRIFYANKSRRQNKDYREWALAFANELKALLTLLAQYPHRRVRIFLYTSPVRVVDELIRQLHQQPLQHCLWLINLTSIYVKSYPVSRALQDRRNQLKLALSKKQEQLRRLYNLHLYTDTESYADFIARYGARLHALPMFSVTKLGVGKVPHQEARPLRVVYPSNAQELKGFDLLPEAIRLAEARAPGCFAFVIRTHIPLQREQSALGAAVNALPDCVEMIAGVLDDSNYQNMLLHSDIMLLPYRAEAFYHRTSGQLMDALILGMPIVATRETWAGQIVEQYNCGATFPDGNTEAMAEAIVETGKNFSKYREGVNRAQEEWLIAQTPAAFFGRLIEPQPPGGPENFSEREDLFNYLQDHFEDNQLGQQKLNYWWQRLREMLAR